MSDEKKLSPLEGIKSNSNYLRGEIAAELADDSDSFGKDSIQLLKHHGTYQQDNRDDRAAARASGGGKAFSMMIRTKIPGGKLTAEQLLAELDISDELGNTTLRITTRQGLQHHGILKRDAKQTIRRINDAELSTLGACGDVNRNVMCCPAPYHADGVHREMQALTDQIAEYFAPRSRAYHEIWLQDSESEEKELLDSGQAAAEVEPIYGECYLPRKFKIGVALPGDNCIDIHTHDLGLLAICENSQIVGYNVLVGGGLGVTPSAKKTFPALSKPLAYVTPDRAIEVIEAVVKMQRDFGNRSDRKVARLKYLVADWGIDAIKSKVEEYYGGPLEAPRDVEVHDHDDHIGWFAQGDGKWFYGLNIENGRIKDEGDFQLKTALREICNTIQPGIRLTAHQGLLLTGLAEDAKGKIDEILTRHGHRRPDEFSTARRWSIACPAMPTCGLSITESERALPGMMDQLEVELERLGLADAMFTTRMTGCPNGCARPYNSDIGLVGKAKDKYTIFLGGRREGDRLNQVYQDSVPTEDVVPQLVKVFGYYKTDRQEGESLGDFCHRKGMDDLVAQTVDAVSAE